MNIEKFMEGATWALMFVIALCAGTLVVLGTIYVSKQIIESL